MVCNAPAAHFYTTSVKRYGNYKQNVKIAPNKRSKTQLFSNRPCQQVSTHHYNLAYVCLIHTFKFK